MEWKPISEPPEKSGYVLIACTYHGKPVVLAGFCTVYHDGSAIFREPYTGQSIVITHWMPLPNDPSFIWDNSQHPEVGGISSKL